jgi:hypothetical protein
VIPWCHLLGKLESENLHNVGLSPLEGLTLFFTRSRSLMAPEQRISMNREVNQNSLPSYSTSARTWRSMHLPYFSPTH